MEVLLDIKDDKALHLLEELKGLSSIKTKQLTDDKAQLMSEIREAVEEVKPNHGREEEGETFKRVSQ